MEYKVPLWSHQSKAVELASSRNHFALFFEQGCGKTATLINILRQKYTDTGYLFSTLILCPQIVIENWKREFLLHSNIPEQDLVCLTGTAKERIATFASQVGSKDKIVITNYESLNMKELYDRLQSWHLRCLVLDESHKCKDVSTKRTKKCIALSSGCQYRFLLSGTPIVNSPFDIFSQYLIMDGGETFSSDLKKFKETYFIDENARRRGTAGYFPSWQPKMGAIKAINAKVYSKAMRVVKDECLDLPPLVKQIVSCDMSPEQRRAYNEIEKDAVTELKGGVVSTDLAIKKALRLQQIATGHVTDDEGEVHVFPDNPRIRALEELLGVIDSSQKVIIWAVFKQNYEDIRKLLRKMRIGFVEITGEVPSTQRQQNIDDFCSSSIQARVLLAHPKSAGIGVNLVSASYSIFYSRSFSLEDDMQAEARNYRGGSERHEKVTRIDIVASGTVDELVMTALSNKQNVSEQILEYMKGRP